MDISSISWDKRELKSLGFQAGGAVTYNYNSEGIRTQKAVYSAQSANPHVVDYLLDGTKILSETHTYSDNSNESYTLNFIYDESGSVTGFKKDGATYFYQKNLQGDVIRIVSVIGVTFVEYTYDAWGNILSITGDQADTLGQLNPFRYRSYYYDSETGFYYLNSRYYDPEVKRFINADKYVSTGQGILGYNMYIYCNNNPVMYVDPSGAYSYVESDLRREIGRNAYKQGDFWRPDPTTYSGSQEVAIYKEVIAAIIANGSARNVQDDYLEYYCYLMNISPDVFGLGGSVSVGPVAVDVYAVSENGKYSGIQVSVSVSTSTSFAIGGYAYVTNTKDASNLSGIGLTQGFSNNIGNFNQKLEVTNSLDGDVVFMKSGLDFVFYSPNNLDFFTSHFSYSICFTFDFTY